MHAAAVKAFAAGECHVRDHLKRRGDHLLKRINPTPCGGIKPGDGTFGGGGHHRGQSRNVAMGEHRCCGTPLPQPFRPFGHEQRIANRRFQNKLCDHGLGIILDPVAQDDPQSLRVHHHMPALASGARQDRRVGGDFGDQLQHVAPPGLQRSPYPQGRGGQRHSDRSLQIDLVKLAHHRLQRNLDTI